MPHHPVFTSANQLGIDRECSPEAFELIEKYVVETVVCVLKVVHLITVNAKRVTIYPKDIDIAVRAMNLKCLSESCMEVDLDQEFKIADRFVRKLTVKVPIRRVGAQSYSKVKSLIRSVVDHLLTHISGQKKIQVSQVEKAIQKCRE